VAETEEYDALALMIHGRWRMWQRDFQVRGLIMRQFMHPRW